MKKLRRTLPFLLALLLALGAGMLVGKVIFEPDYPVGVIKNQPHLFMDRRIKVKGIVQEQNFKIGQLINIFWIKDENTGEELPVQTERSILPPPHSVITIRARLTMPLSASFVRKYLLVEEPEGFLHPLWK